MIAIKIHREDPFLGGPRVCQRNGVKKKKTILKQLILGNNIKSLAG